MKASRLFNFEESALLLVFSNVFTIIIAIVEKWSLSDVMWIYWGQSVVIGFFNWKRIRCLRHFSTDGVTINDEPVLPTRATQNKIASFFAMHYGLFHAVYLGFLCGKEADMSRLDIVGGVACIAVFAANHQFSFRHNLERDVNRKPNIGSVMLFPYARIIPMQVTILFGAHFAKHAMGIMILFLSLKTLADIIMHLIEHRENSQPKDLP